MSKRGSAAAVLAGAAIFALAGCTGAPNGTTPDVPGQRTASTAPGAASAASRAAQIPGTRPSATPSTGTRASTSRDTGSESFVKADSIPFPVAVGNTWVYKTTSDAGTGRTTNRIVSAGPGQDGYRVTVSTTTDLPGTAAVQSVYVFYPDGTIGYPVTPVPGVSVAGVVRWPDAAGLASGRPYHPMLRGQGETPNVTVQGQGTTPVTVPAGTFQTSVVIMTIPAKSGTVEITTWIAEGIGPVKTITQIRVAGQPQLLTTSELQSFTKGASVGIGS